VFQIRSAFGGGTLGTKRSTRPSGQVAVDKKIFRMTTLSGTHKFKDKDYTVYKDTHRGLEFIFIDGEEEKFHSLLKQHGSPKNFPDSIFLTGIYFKEGTRDARPNHPNSNIEAKYIGK
jgi:hypothetical protein